MQNIHNSGERIPPPPAAQSQANGILDSIRECMGFASLLRNGGALMVLAAMSAFILQDWHAGNDTSRYYMLLLQMFLLAAGGFALSYLLQENKGARVFFGLSMLSVSAHMATLGALVFSVVQWGGALGDYPGFARWQADSASLGLALACGIVASAPVLWFGHMLFARRSSRMLAMAGLFANLLLLVPVRGSVLFGIVALLAVAVPLWAIWRRLPQDGTLRAPGGYFAMTSLFVPAAIIIARTLWFYEADALLDLILASLGFALLHLAHRLLDGSSRWNSVFDGISAAVAVRIALSATELAAPLLPAEIEMFLCTAIFSGLLTFIGLRGAVRKAGYLRVAALVMALGNGLMLLDDGSLLAALLCLGAGACLMVAGRRLGERLPVFLGVALAMAALGQQCYHIIAWVDFGSWITLSVLGVSAIVGASVIERHGPVLRHKWSQWAGAAGKGDAQ